MSTIAPNAEGVYVCPHGCGKSYEGEFGERALKRHLSEKHGGPLSKSALRRHELGQVARALPAQKKIVPSLNDEMVAQLETFAAPMREQLATIDARLEVLKQEADGLRETKTRIEMALHRLLPDLAPAKGKTTAKIRPKEVLQQDPGFLKKVEAIEAYLVAHRVDYAEGFTVNYLSDALRAENFDPPVGRDTLQIAIDVLRDRGILRADRIVQGGGQAFVLVSRNGGTPHAS